MSLIVCPECKNEISEYASSCPHCGCPMDVIKQNTSNQKIENCIIDGKTFNLSSAKNLILNGKFSEGVNDIENITNLNSKNARDLGMAIKLSSKVPLVYPMDIKDAPLQADGTLKECPVCYDKYNNNVDFCPKCCVKLNTKPIIKRYGIMKPSYKVIQTESYLPKCPTCGSPDVEKIGGFERGVSVFTIGIFSKKINKSYKCNNCGYMW